VATTRLYLVRHGATNLTAEDRFSGTTGDLSAEGRKQIEKLAERLRGEGIQALYSSPLPRAVDSAHILGAAIELVPTLREGLREIDHGRWEGLTHAEARERFAAEYAAWQTNPFDHAPAGGESGAAVLARAMPVVREIVEAHAGQRVVAVSHKATLRLVICDLLGIDPRGYRDKLEQLPACLNVLDFTTALSPRLIRFNEVSHDRHP
jgi:broad specificity phosphatase PhoE